MPYYVCPKCGSKDSYEATEIVSEHHKGSSTTITGPENDLGFQPSFTSHQDGETTHRELTVSKCRQCDCLLGSKDLRLTEGELKLQREKRAKLEEEEKRAAEFGNENLWFIIFLGIIVAFIILIVWAGS
tara:strand:- start:397 stop:783 length:387 start_codon:yes stop_codon:yes gene_type:complete